MFIKHFLWLLRALLVVKFLAIVSSVDNNVIFEKIECAEPRPDAISVQKCEMRPIASNVFRMNLTLHFHKPLNNLWIHTIAYQRFSTYEKFVDLWENFCGYFRDPSKSPITKLLFNNLKLIDFDEKYLACPLANNLTMTYNKLNMSHFVLPLLPAARYKVDLSVAHDKNGRSIGFVQIFFRISDFRLWIWVIA